MHGEEERTSTRAGGLGRVRVFSSHSSESRARRPTDLVLGVVCALGLLVVTLVAPDVQEELGKQLAAFLDPLPGLFNWIWALSYDALVTWSLLLLGLAMFSRGRSGLVRDLVMALITATVVSGWINTADGAGWKELLAGFDGTPPATFPAVRLALAVGVISTASPHLGKPIRQAGRWVIALGMISTVILGTALPLGVLAALCIGFGSAALLHLVFGSPGVGRPSTRSGTRSPN